MTDQMVYAEGVEFSYDSKERILKGVGLELNRGEILGILGPNGSGKTTFLKCINRILEPSQGKVLLNGDDIAVMRKRDIARKVGLVPQSSSSDTSSPMVYDVVMMGRRPHMTWQFTDEDDRIVWNIMERLDVAHLASHHFNELSSGQSQRVLIARAIAQNAEILLLDEPTSNLDVRYQMDVMDLICGLVEENDVSVCAIIHDLDLAMKYCDKVVLIKEGVVMASGGVDEVMTPENIQETYGIEVIVENIHGRRRVMVV